MCSRDYNAITAIHHPLTLPYRVYDERVDGQRSHSLQILLPEGRIQEYGELVHEVEGKPLHHQ